MSIFTQAAPLESLFDSYEPCLTLVVLVVAIYKHAVFFIFSFLKFTFFHMDETPGEDIRTVAAKIHS